MTGHRPQSAYDAQATYAEREKTYKTFLWLLAGGGAATAVVLLALYFILAR